MAASGDPKYRWPRTLWEKKFMFHWRKISLFQFHLYFSASSAFEIYKLCQKNLIKVKRSMKDQAKKSLGK